MKLNNSPLKAYLSCKTKIFRILGKIKKTLCVNEPIHWGHVENAVEILERLQVIDECLSERESEEE